MPVLTPARDGGVHVVDAPGGSVVTGIGAVTPIGGTLMIVVNSICGCAAGGADSVSGALVVCRAAAGECTGTAPESIVAHIDPATFSPARFG